jgi:PPP family 3-phenylpropionic acid transporter
LQWRAALASVAAFLVASVHLPYFPSWLSARGLSAEWIGIALAIPQLVRIVAAPVVSAIADRTGRPAPVMLACAALAFVAFAAMWAAPSPWLILTLIAVSALVASPLVPLSDTMLSELARRRPSIPYARARLWGSVAFIGGNVAGGLAVARYGPEAAMALIVGGALVACLLLLPALRPAEFRLPGRADAGEGALSAPGGDGRGLALAILVAALVNASHAMLYGFGTISWLAAGVPPGWIGLLWSVGVAAEILLFYAVAGRFRDTAFAVRALWLALGFAALRWSLSALALPLPALFLLQLTHAATFGLTHLATIALVAALSGAGARAKAQGYTMSASGLAMALASAPTGWLYARFGDAAYLFMIGLVVAAGMGLLTLMRHLHLRAGPGGPVPAAARR